MADETKPAAPAPGPTPSLNPEAELAAKISLLQTEVQTHENEVRILEGRLKNRNPALTAEAKKENAILKARIEKLEKTLFALLQEAIDPRHAEELLTSNEVLKKNAAEYCKNASIDAELWKNIAS